MNEKNTTILRTDPFTIDVSKDLLLIYNTNSTDSGTVLNYYLANRPGVSNANVLGVGFPGFSATNATVWYSGSYTNPANANQITYGYYITNATAYESIYVNDFTNMILAPVTNWLASNPTKRPEYVILFLDIPSRVETAPITSNTFPYWPTTNGSVSYQLSTAVGGWRPLITHINMYGTNDCKAYIDKIASFGSNYCPGKLIISASAGGYSNTNYCIDDTGSAPFNYLGNIQGSSNAIALDSVGPFSVTYSTSAITNAANAAGYVSLGTHSGVLNFTFPIDNEVNFTGASAWYPICTIESYDGLRYWNISGPQYQSSFLMWFAPEAFGGTNYSNTPVGAFSNSDEPGETGIVDIGVYFGLWAAGKNFAICAWAAHAGFPPMIQATGDPFVTK